METIAIGKPIMPSAENDKEENAKNVQSHNRKRKQGSMTKLVKIIGRMGKKRHKDKHQESACELEEKGEKNEDMEANDELPEDEVQTGIEEEQQITIDNSDRHHYQCSNSWINQAQEKAIDRNRRESNHREGNHRGSSGGNRSNHSDSDSSDNDKDNESDNDSEVGNGSNNKDSQDDGDDDDDEDDDSLELSSSAGSRSSCIIRVTLRCSTGYSLGFDIEGGSDTPLKYICIKSIVPNSPAFESGCFREGDQLVTIGTACLIGVTFNEAQHILSRAPKNVKVIAQRKLAPMQEDIRATLLKNGASYRQRTPPKVISLPIQVLTNLEHDDPPKKDGSAKQDTSIIHTTPLKRNTPPFKQDPSPPALISKHVVSFRSSSDHFPGMKMEVEMRCGPGEFFGIVIIGGKDDPYLKNIHVKELVPGGVAIRHGGIKRGDCIVSVNGSRMAGLSTADALAILKEAGDHVTLVTSRVAENWTSSCPRIPISQESNSRQEARDRSSPQTLHSSPACYYEGENRTLEHARKQAEAQKGQGGSQQSQAKPISVDYSRVESWRMSLQWNIHSGETSDEGIPRQARQLMLSPENKQKFSTRNPQGEIMTFTDTKSTLPRKLPGNKAGVYLVELQKSDGGLLGLQLEGSNKSPSNAPITIKSVLKGGAAYKSGQICEKDEIIEVNGVSFEKITLVDAVEYMRDLPAGEVRMIMRDHRNRWDLNSCRNRLF